MKRIFILFLFFLFVSCGENVFIIENGVYYYKESSIIVEILNDGYDNLCIGRIGDATGVFNELKRNSLVTEIEQVLQDSINNGKFNDFFVGADEPYWYTFDEFNKIDAIIGDNGAYISLGESNFNLIEKENTYVSSFENTLKSNSDVETSSSWLFLIEKFDNGDYLDLKATKVFIYEWTVSSVEYAFEIEPVVTRVFYDESWDIVDSYEVNLIDMVNNDNFVNDNKLENYINPYFVLCKELPVE